ncbi:MAG: carboxypeptidase M32 [Planctomycetota bacterium]|nr:carboxypeptidase M32 [Planctomycetota bacterium]
MSDSTTCDKLYNYTQDTARLASVVSVLGWDERTQMPPAAAEHRGRQIQALAGIIHDRNTAPQVGEWLAELADSTLAEDGHSDSGTVIRQLKRSYDKQSKLPRSLVEELARIEIEGQQIWQRARADNDFAAFRPILEQIVELKRQQADAIGYPECRYDALLDDFEPEELTSNIRRVLEGLREDLVPLIREIVESGRSPDVSILKRHYPEPAQADFGTTAADEIGFDFSRGRLDVTAHPFCSGMGPNDTRITTRYDERFFPSAFFGILHEAGHGIYDQGLRNDFYGLPPGEAVSLGIHESQSRMWENQVGRSRAYWQYKFAAAQRAFSGALSDIAVDDFFFAINAVQPSLIRVEADEATYNLHILIRFELEQAMLDGDIPIADLPAAWNQKYQDYLGILPPNDTDGVLQDIHWSGGAIGYFATYSLGNLYAAQFFAQADEELGGLSDQFARGDFQPLRQWLNEKIHSPGQCYRASELVEQVTGRPLSHRYLIEYLRGKLEPLYGI